MIKGRWWALIALAFCLLVIGLDMTVLNVALPTLARDLKATESQLQWMVDAYTLVYASLILLGGFLLDHFSWGIIFLINVPVVLLAVPICAWLVPESRDPLASRLDPLGALLSIAGMFELLFGIIEAPTYGLADPRILLALGAAIALLTSFVIWERRTSTPMLDMTIFRNTAISASILALTLASFGLTGGLFFLTQYLQLALGFSPTVAGLSFTPLILGLIIASVGLSPLLDRLIGSKFTITIGLTLVAIGTALFALMTLNTTYLEIALILFLLGFGLGITMVPATTAIMGSLPLNRAGVGSAATDTAQETGSALGVAVVS